MGMPVTIEIINCRDQKIFKQVFDFFRGIDQQFSPYKKNSEVSQINRGVLKENDFSVKMKKILSLAKKTELQTDGYFNVFQNHTFDPSGIVKGWAILEAAKILKKNGQKNFFIEAGGDIQVSGRNDSGERWKIGIKNPFQPSEIVKVLNISSHGVATSGSYERGQHIYNPKGGEVTDDVVSLTVIGHNIYEADRFATAAFAMGEKGLQFIDSITGLEGYAIKKNGVAIFTRNFDQFTK
jgi:thiamine biosynthesis lipoprotein